MGITLIGSISCIKMINRLNVYTKIYTEWYNINEVIIMAKIEAKIFRHGNSQAITLNKEALYKTGFDIGDVLECHIKDGKLVFEKKEMPSFKERIHDFYRNGGSYNEHEVFDDQPTGTELW